MIVLCIGVGVLGLVFGSFLNVVITRLPQMLDADWRRSAADLLGQAAPEPERFNLAWPRSACPRCGTPIRAWQNIPLVSYVMQRGRCAACGERISLQYPLVELGAAVVALVCVWRFGPTATGALAIVVSWALLTLAVIDLQTQLLPDDITLPLLWLGLLAAATGLSINPLDAIIGAAAGYLALWLVFHAFRLLTAKHGMGHGDFKLLAALGAWLGWQQLPVVLVLASAAGAIVGIGLVLCGRLQRGTAMPFGPFLAAAGWLSLIAGDTMLQRYLALAGLS